MRNVFDQYHQPENRITHALVSALHEDPELLQAFVTWVTGETPAGKLHIVEQRLPGEADPGEETAERRGLPDAWIYNDDGWSLLIESKVAAPLELDQLHRHLVTAKQRGFPLAQLLALDTEAPNQALPPRSQFRLWSDVYQWLAGQSGKSSWAGRVCQYLEVAEAQWPADGYLKAGTLTKFSGFKFDDDNPYNYSEAKRLLKLSMAALRENEGLTRALAIDPQAPGRPAIMGKGGQSVWDLLRFRGLDTGNHTTVPHLTLAIQQDQVRAVLLVPDKVQGPFRKRLMDQGEAGFFAVLAAVTERMQHALKGVEGAYPFFDIYQRHFPSRSAPPVTDAQMCIDLRTAFSASGNGVKHQPQWLAAGYALFCQKQSNIEFAVGAAFPYASCSKTRDPEILAVIAATYLACQPLRDVMLASTVDTSGLASG